VLSAGEGETERARALLSNNHLLPLSAIQGRNKIELSSPLKSSAGTEEET